MYKSRARFVQRSSPGGCNFNAKKQKNIKSAVSRSNGRINRAIEQKRKAAEIEKKASLLKTGEIYHWRVIKLLERGAVVSFSGIKGFLHISEITTKWLNHPNEALKIDQLLTLMILSNQIDDKGRRSIKLSRKRILK
jgi:ribosomal protein S1